MTKQKLKAAIAFMADRENVACDVAAKLEVSLSALYAFVDAKGSRARVIPHSLRSKRRCPCLPTLCGN
jgi:hypothetical protein